MHLRLFCLSNVTLFSNLMESYPTCFVPASLPSPSLLLPLFLPLSLLPLSLFFLPLSSSSFPPPLSPPPSPPPSLPPPSLTPLSLLLPLSSLIAFLFPLLPPPPPSPGLRPTGFYGAFFMSNTTDIELGNIDADKAIAVEIKHDDKLKEDDIAFFQVS